MLPNNQWIIEEIKEEIQKYLEGNDNENKTLQKLWAIAKAVLRPKDIRRKEIIKIRAEMNEIEMKKNIEKSNKNKNWFFEKINKIEKPLVRLIKKKKRGLKSIKLEMKKEKLQRTSQKYRGSYETTTYQ